MSYQKPILASLDRLHSLVPQLDELGLEAHLLSEKVSSTAETAERVGGRVHFLDEEMRRVREAGERVGQVIELKSSLTSLQFSIDSQNWESAARHCARAMTLPFEVISGSFAETAVPTSESHLPPAQTLQIAREQLLAIFRQQFEQASQSRDAAATTRFFKLFPAIGWEAEGLQAYASFVVDLVRVRTPTSAKASSPLFYITALTALFESVAMIVDQHQPVVEKYYGPGKMTSVVDRLLQECDRVVVKLVQGWEEERSMKRMLADISNSTFPLSNGSPLTRKQHSFADDGAIDPRDVDKLLLELAGMTGRWGLFRKFLIGRLKGDALEKEVEAIGETALSSAISNTPVTYERLETLQFPHELQSIESTTSHTLFEGLLSTYYVPMEMWYTRSIIDKAHNLSSSDLSQVPATTTTPDDVFYVLKLVLSRLLSTGSVKTVERSIGLLQDVMEHNYAGTIKRKLDDVYRNANNAGTVTRERTERENRAAFIIHLNDLDVSISHIERLAKELLSYSSISQNYIVSEQPVVKSAVSSLSTLAPKFRSTLRAGVEQLFNQLMRPKLRTLISDVYKDVSYIVNEDVYSNAEHQDVVRKRFVKTWEGLVDGYKETFTEGNYRIFFGLALDVLLRPWEKYIMSLKFTELGAIRFDRDLRSIMAHLSSQTAFGDTREKFVRLQQISTLLNLDSEEDVDEFYSGSGIIWKLNTQEARAVSGLRI